MNKHFERLIYFGLICLLIGVTHNVIDLRVEQLQTQLTAYQDSVNVLIEVNKKLHAVQTMYSDTIVEAMKGEPIDFEKLRQRYKEALQEVNHGTK